MDEITAGERRNQGQIVEKLNAVPGAGCEIGRFFELDFYRWRAF
jgi:hypothetical protein